MYHPDAPPHHPADDEPDTIPYSVEVRQAHVIPFLTEYLRPEETLPGIGSSQIRVVKPRRLVEEVDRLIHEAEQKLRDAAYVMRAHRLTSAAVSVSSSLAHIESAKRKLTG